MKCYCNFEYPYLEFWARPCLDPLHGNPRPALQPASDHRRRSSASSARAMQEEDLPPPRASRALPARTRRRRQGGRRPEEGGGSDGARVPPEPPNAGDDAGAPVNLSLCQCINPTQLTCPLSPSFLDPVQC
jgi:hypothetical protein